MRKLFLLASFFLFLFLSPSPVLAACSKDAQFCRSDSECHDQTASCNGYYCDRSSGAGGTCKYSADRLQQPLELPTNFSIVRVESDKVEVRWDQKSGVEKHEISYTRTGTTSFQKKSVTTLYGYYGQTIIEGLQPETEYSLRLTACNAAGCTVPVGPLQAKTTAAGVCARQGETCGPVTNITCCLGFSCQYDPSGTSGVCQADIVRPNNNPLSAPQNFKAKKIMHDSIELIWDLVTYAERYEIEYNKGIQPYIEKATLPPFTVKGLDSQNTYAITIKACNTGGCSSSTSLQITTTAARSTSFSISPMPPTPIPPKPPCKLFDPRDQKCLLVDTALGDISTTPQDFVKSIFAIILSLSGGVALLLIIFSGYKLIMSQGNPEKAQEAKETLTAAIVGLLFILFSLVILQVIGVDILRIPGFDR